MLDPADLARFRDFLVTHAAGYLRNPIREYRVTCSTCAAPVDGYPRCIRCNDHFQTHGTLLADAVAPLTYAVGGDQAAYMMRGYKGHPPVNEHVLVVSILTWIGIVLHTGCVGRLVSRPVTHWATVPSLPAKPGEHPLHRIVAINPPAPWEIVLTPSSGAMLPRAAEVGHFAASMDLPPESHVLLLEDTWVRGGHAQSAALELRHAGAEKVSIMVTARWINREFGHNDRFIRDRLTTDYDPAICPWTGADCPS